MSEYTTGGPYDSLVAQERIWDLRPEGARDPRAIYPPVKCLVVNAQNERIPGVFHVNFVTGVVGKWKCRVDEFGIETYDVTYYIDPGTGETKRKLIEEWVEVPGVHVIPFPPGYEEERMRAASRRKKKLVADSEGRVTETTS